MIMIFNKVTINKNGIDTDLTLTFDMISNVTCERMWITFLKNQ